MWEVLVIHTARVQSRFPSGLLSAIAVIALALGNVLVGSAASATVPGALAGPTLASNGVHLRHACQSPARGAVACDSLVAVNADGAATRSSSPYGWGATDIEAAYRGNVNRGGGETVGIVDAYDDANAEAELAAYRAQYGLPACTTANGCFSKLNQTGGTSPLPPSGASTGWVLETALDLQMVSATCPLCHIVLVEANTNYFSDIVAAVNTAAARSNAVSNSYGGPEFNAYSSYYNHPGVAMVASSGDGGFDGGPQVPAAFSTVTAVGGTVLTRDSSTRGFSETVWGGAGSGCSLFVAKPTYQHDSGCGNRTIADVAAVATGVATYSTYYGGWVEVAGTSISSPIIASMYALAGDTSTYTNPARLYANSSDLIDISAGQNGTCSTAYLCHGTVGYDGPTGMGTPNGDLAFESAPQQPGPPTSIVATPGNASISIAFGPPSDPGSSSISSYTATCASSNGGAPGTNSGSGSPLVVSGLSNGDTYTCTVHATNSSGSGPESSPSTPVVPNGVKPGAPTSIVATPGNASISIAFSPPSDPGSSSISSYTATCASSNGGAPGTNSGSGSPLVVSGLTNGDIYTCTVHATNSSGSGPESSQSAPVVPSGVKPGPPTSVVATRGNTSISVRFSPPSNHGSSPIIAYTATCTSSNGGAMGTNSGTSSPIVVSGLTNGDTYTCTANATNSYGSGPESSPSTPVVPQSPVVVGLGGGTSYEGDAGSHSVSYPVTLSIPTTKTVTVRYKVFTASGNTATANVDYKATPGTLTFSPTLGGLTPTVAFIPVTIYGDTKKEPNETYSVQLTGVTNATLGTSLVTGTIFNDDPGTGIRATVTTNAIVEGNQVATVGGSNAMKFDLLLSKPVPAHKTVVLTYTVTAGTATGCLSYVTGCDFLETSNPVQVTFAAGQQDKSLLVRTFADTTVEPNETFNVNLTRSSGTAGAVIEHPTGKGIIVNDDRSMSSTYQVGKNPPRMAFEEPTLLVSGVNSNNVERLDVQTGSAVANYNAGPAQWGAASDGSMWAANYFSLMVTKLSDSTWADLGV